MSTFDQDFLAEYAAHIGPNKSGKQASIDSRRMLKSCATASQRCTFVNAVLSPLVARVIR